MFSVMLVMKYFYCVVCLFVCLFQVFAVIPGVIKRQVVYQIGAVSEYVHIKSIMCLHDYTYVLSAAVCSTVDYIQYSLHAYVHTSNTMYTITYNVYSTVYVMIFVSQLCKICINDLYCMYICMLANYCIHT